MVNLIRLAALLFVLAAAVPASADWTPNDFAYGLLVSPPAGATLAELRVSDLVYRQVVFPDLRDVRVFDASGALTLHTFELPAFSPQQSSIEPPFFPVMGLQHAPGSALSVVTSNGDQSVQVAMAGTKRIPGARTVAYLIDLKPLEKMEDQRAVTSVVLGWRGLPAGTPLRISVEASDDLQQWHIVQSGSVIAEFVQGSTRLVVDHIELPVVKAKYLKLYWEPQSAFEITSLRILLVDRSKPQLQRDLEIATAERDGEEKGAYTFTLAGAFPVDRIRIPLQKNHVIGFTVFTRARSEDAWQLRGAGNAFRLSQGGKVVQSPPAPIERTQDRQWKIVVRGDDAIAGVSTFKVELGWVAHALRFLPQGASPYTIAYGNGKAMKADFAVDSLEQATREALKYKPQIEPAQILSAQILGGPTKLAIPPPNQKNVLLWVFLLAGVGLFGYMALRLVREMRAGSGG